MTDVLAGHLLVSCLIDQGVELAFGVPGESYLAVLDGLYAERERLRFVHCRHEGGAAFMAEAYGKLTGRPGVCMVTRGPGACNAAIGVHTAYQDSTPLVLLVGDVGAAMRDREAFQEVDFAALFGPGTRGMAKRVERIDDPARIPEAVRRAFATALNGRPGPAVLVLPEDMLARRVPEPPRLSRVVPTRPACDPVALERVADMLRAAQRPFVIAGGSSWTPAGARALETFAAAWSIPVGNAFRFQDTFDNRHPQYAGDVGIAINPRLAAHIAEADLVLAIGVRLGEMTTSGYTLLQAPRARQQLVHVHPDALELDRVFVADVAICAGAEAAARALADLPAPTAPPWQAWAGQCHADYLANLQGPLPPAGALQMREVIAVLERLLPADAVLTNGAGNFASWLHRFFRYRGLSAGARTQLAPTNGAMGYGVPAGIAANLASGRLAVTFTGDGDFLMNGQELATAALHGARSIVILVNNGGYGTIRMHQERNYPGRVSATELANPDFCALARAHGWQAHRIETTEQFEPALRAALHCAQGTLLELMLPMDVITTRATLQQLRRAD